jgi:uncharacterized protein YihD (DUF1040 family)
VNNKRECALISFLSKFVSESGFEKISENAREVFLKTAKLSFEAGWIARDLQPAPDGNDGE